MRRSWRATTPIPAAWCLLFADVDAALIVSGCAREGERARLHGVVRGPAGAGRAAYVSREDVARTAAACLSSEWSGNRVFDVTGPEAITLDEAAMRLSALSGRTLRYVDETVEESRRWRAASGAPDWEVETRMGSYLATAAGELAEVSETVERFTGRRPATLEEYFTVRPELLDGLRKG